MSDKRSFPKLISQMKNGKTIINSAEGWVICLSVYLGLCLYVLGVPDHLKIFQ